MILKRKTYGDKCSLENFYINPYMIFYFIFVIN